MDMDTIIKAAWFTLVSNQIATAAQLERALAQLERALADANAKIATLEAKVKELEAMTVPVPNVEPDPTETLRVLH